MIEKIRAVIASKLIEGSFARNVATLVTGALFAQILQVLIMPILTRLYSPGNFGVFSIYSSLTEIITVVACLRYENAIVISENDETAANLFALCIFLNIGFIAAAILMVVFFRDAIAAWLGTAELGHYLWFLPLSILAAGVFLPLNYWSIRRQQFHRLAVRQVTGSSATLITQLGAGIILTPQAGSLIFGSIFGQMIATSKLAWQICQEEGRQILDQVNIRKLKEVARRYKKFPLYDSWATILNATSYVIPVLLLAYYFNSVVVGYYALGIRVLSIPGTLIGQAVYQAFFQKAAETNRFSKLAGITLELFKQLLRISFIPLALVTIVAPDLFNIIFGSNWRIAGQYLQWLSLSIALKFISSPISSIYSVLEKQKKLFLFNILLLIVRIAGLMIGGMHKDPLLAIQLYGLGSAAMFLYFILNIMHMAGVSVWKVCKVLALEVLKSIPYMLLPLGIGLFFHNSTLFVIAAILSGLVFAAILLKQFSSGELRESSSLEEL